MHSYSVIRLNRYSTHRQTHSLTVTKICSRRNVGNAIAHVASHLSCEHDDDYTRVSGGSISWCRGTRRALFGSIKILFKFKKYIFLYVCRLGTGKWYRMVIRRKHIFGVLVFVSSGYIIKPTLRSKYAVARILRSKIIQQFVYLFGQAFAYAVKSFLMQKIHNWTINKTLLIHTTHSTCACQYHVQPLPLLFTRYIDWLVVGVSHGGPHSPKQFMYIF